MKFKVTLVNQNYSLYPYGDRETRQVYYKRDSSSDEMKTFQYLLFSNNSNSNSRIFNKFNTSNDIHQSNVDYSILSMDNWCMMCTEFQKENIKNLFQSSVKTLYRTDVKSWNNIQPVFKELSKDNREVYTSIFISVEKVYHKSCYHSYGKLEIVEEEDLLLRFECFLAIEKDNTLIRNITIHENEKVPIDYFEEKSPNHYTSIFELELDILLNNQDDYPKKYKELIDFKPVFSKKRKRLLNKLSLK